jgi:hypothetical protein
VYYKSVSDTGQASFDRGEFYPKVKKWIVERFGVDKYREFKKTLPKRLSNRLETADNAGWYPVEDSRLLYEKMFDYLGQNHLEDYVKFYTNEAINGFIRGLVAFMSPLGLAKRAAALWGRFHSTGKVEVKFISKTHGLITLHNWNYSPIHCEIHRLWYAELARIAGARNVLVTEIQCVHRGDSHCCWEVKFD